MAKCKCGHGKKWHDEEAGCLRGLDYGKGCPCAKYRSAKTERATEYDFDFCVSFPDFPDSSDEIAKGIMDLVVRFVETFHGQVGGGYKVHDDEAS